MKRPMETSIVGTGLAALLAVITAGQRETHPGHDPAGAKAVQRAEDFDQRNAILRVRRGPAAGD